MGQEVTQQETPSEAPAPAYVQRDLRYRTRDSGVARVVVHRADGACPRTVSAELVDISLNGAKLLLPICLPFEESIDIRLDVASVGLRIDVRAAVRWVRPAGGEAWFAGCVFNSELSDDVIQKLIAGKCLERRSNPRQKISLQAVIHWGLFTEDTPASLDTLSPGGFSMTTTNTGRVGERILLHIATSDGSEAVVQAQLQWRLETDDGYQVGCSFLNGHGYAALTDAVAAEEDRRQQRERVRPAKEWLRGPFVGAMTILALVLPTLIMLAVPSRGDQRTTRAGENDHDRPVVSNQGSDTESIGSMQLGTEATDPDATHVKPPTERTWTDRTGKYTVVATFVDLKDGIVRLRKQNGRLKSVPIERLSAADRELARDSASAD